MNKTRTYYADINIVAAQKLSSEKQDRWLFKDVSFSVEPGHIFHIQGANGSGKTTLLRILCGLTTADSGQVLWGDKPIQKQHDQYHTQLSYVGHTDGIKQDLTVEENLKVAAVLAQGKQQNIRDSNWAINLDDILRQVGLLKKKFTFAHALSAGQRRRLALARCLLNDASIWILDEPLTALDAQGVGLVEDLLQNHIQRKGIAIITSHQTLNISGAHYEVLNLS